MSEFEQAAEAFRQKWGSYPIPDIKSAFRRGEFDLEGGTEDERAFIREVLTGCGSEPGAAVTTDDDTPIGLNCPECGEPPRFVMDGGKQAFCGNTGGCRILAWDPTQTRAEMEAEGVHEIDLRGEQQ